MVRKTRQAEVHQKARCTFSCAINALSFSAASPYNFKHIYIFSDSISNKTVQRYRHKYGNA